MKRLLTLFILVLAVPCAQAGTPVVNTIITNQDPPYLVPPLGEPVPVGGSATTSVVLSKVAGSASLITQISLVPGSDFAIIGGGTCVPNVTTLTNPGENCSINVQFSPTATGARAGTLLVDCTPVPVAGGITINCVLGDVIVAEVALSGVGAILAALSVPVPTGGRYELTALAMLLFALAAWSLRRRP